MPGRNFWKIPLGSEASVTQNECPWGLHKHPGQQVNSAPCGIYEYVGEITPGKLQEAKAPTRKGFAFGSKKANNSK